MSDIDPSLVDANGDAVILRKIVNRKPREGCFDAGRTDRQILAELLKKVGVVHFVWLLWCHPLPCLVNSKQQQELVMLLFYIHTKS